MQDKNLVRRRRAVAVLLVVVSFGLLTLYFGEGRSGGLHAIQRGAQAVLGPIESGASRVLKPFRDATGWVGDSLDAKDENEQLRAEVAQLRQQLATSQTDQREAQQLRSLVGLPEEDNYPAGTDPLTARVIAHSPTVWYSTLRVDKGSDDGVEVDQPVVTADGLAGKVTDVTGGNAEVTLITDADSAVSAQVVPRGARGIVQPKVGDPNDLLLDFIDKSDRIEEGDTVVTSGSTSSEFESLFPRGIPIGKVTNVDPGERDLYQRVHMEPFADLKRLDFVQILTGEPQAQTAEVSGP